MSKAAYWQRGEALDYKNTGTAKIEANTIIVLGSRIGVAGMEISPGEVGTLHVTGVYSCPKVASAAINAERTCILTRTQERLPAPQREQ